MVAATRLLVIGGDAAGMSAAARARRTDPSLDIVALEAGPHTSYSMCGLPYVIGGLVPSFERLVARTPEQFRAQGIQVHTGRRARSLDLARGVVLADAGAAGEETYAFDRLVIGTGARPRPLGVPGDNLPGVFGLRDLRDGRAICDWLTARRARRAVVVGAGLVGLEMAESFLARGLDVTLVQRSAHVLGDVDAEMAQPIHDELRQQGAHLLLQRHVEAVEGDVAGGVQAVVVGGERLAAEVVLVAVGVVPNAEIAVEAGLATGAAGAILVGADQRVAGGDGRVFAAGDCATAPHRVTGQPAWVPLGTTANKQGRVAGENAAGGAARFPGIVGTAITRVCALEVAFTGLNLKQAQQQGLDAVATTIRSTDIAGYMPDAVPLSVRLVGERGTGRLLGGQLVGRGAKRVDVLAAALHTSLPVAELGWLDVAYAPPFSSVWDPLLVAAQELAKQV